MQQEGPVKARPGHGSLELANRLSATDAVPSAQRRAVFGGFLWSNADFGHLDGNGNFCVKRQRNKRGIQYIHSTGQGRGVGRAGEMI